MATPIEILKFNLQETEYPYFSENNLQLLLETNDNDIAKASYKGCLLKAASEDKIEVAGIKLSSNREYWLTLAESFKGDMAPINSSLGGYKTSMKRVDGC